MVLLPMNITKRLSY